MKHQRSTTTGVPALKSRGRLITDPKQKAEVLNSQVFTAFSTGISKFRTKCTMPDSRDDFPPMADISINSHGVEKQLNSPNPTKASGPEGITPRVFKELSKEVIPILIGIYQSSLETGVVPRDWKEALAFDRVSHSLLTHKLDHYSIRGSTNRWIENFLAYRHQAVAVDGAQSSRVAVKSGVPQSSVLGPCLFQAYINDLPTRISSPSRLFAEDTAVYRFSDDPSKL
ncbi:uncharacterized protein LOC143283516 [Babylonia areolata]|uniref:uncharacterized protein LOC143283516 n=1 Tax=Babylonia areolata TaxID=304850 RepID=UPI003FD5A11C